FFLAQTLDIFDLRFCNHLSFVFSMMLQQPVKFLLPVLIMAAVASGCVTVKSPFPKKPFVFSTAINIQGNLPSAEKQDLKDRLENERADSLKKRVKTGFPGYKGVDRPAGI